MKPTEKVSGGIASITKAIAIKSEKILYYLKTNEQHTQNTTKIPYSECCKEHNRGPNHEKSVKVFLRIDSLGKGTEEGN